MYNDMYPSLWYYVFLKFPGGSDGNEYTYNVGDLCSIPGLERSPGGLNGNPLQYSCLENTMDRGPWHSVVHEASKSWTGPSDFHKHTYTDFQYFSGLPCCLSGKEPACNTRAAGNAGLTHGLGGSLGRGQGNPLQYSCLENTMDKGAWWATVHSVAKSWTLMKWLSMHTQALYKERP